MRELFRWCSMHLFLFWCVGCSKLVYQAGLRGWWLDLFYNLLPAFIRHAGALEVSRRYEGSAK